MWPALADCGFRPTSFAREGILLWGRLMAGYTQAFAFSSLWRAFPGVPDSLAEAGCCVWRAFACA